MHPFLGVCAGCSLDVDSRDVFVVPVVFDVFCCSVEFAGLCKSLFIFAKFVVGLDGGSVLDAGLSVTVVVDLLLYDVVVLFYGSVYLSDGLLASGAAGSVCVWSRGRF